MKTIDELIDDVRLYMLCSDDETYKPTPDELAWAMACRSFSSDENPVRQLLAAIRKREDELACAVEDLESARHYLRDVKCANKESSEEVDCAEDCITNAIDGLTEFVYVSP
jgi:hypothetical protein